ncbi:MAG: hypothetical protein HKN17_06050 [Rhodothermales bacterium]|nr:hypothetical protein [Rhodothermales bacterium]
MSHFLTVLALLVSLAVAGETGSVWTHDDTARPVVESVAAHDFHVSYGRMAVEGASVAVRFRFFVDDLQKTLRAFSGNNTATITDDPASWVSFESYLGGAFELAADGDTLGGLIIGSGEDVLDNEPVRWFLVQYTAADTVRSVTVRNRLLFDVFDDQKNIVQFRHFPSEENGSLYFTHDRSSYELDF